MIELTGIEPRNSSRIRLVFSNLVASGAYGIAPSLYTVTANTASGGAAIIIKAAVVVPGASNNVELVLADELLAGASYVLTAIGVPAQDASISTVASTQQFTYSNALGSQLNREPELDDGEALQYGIDLIWTGLDFQETQQGDLARVSGPGNAIAAVIRRLFANGLPWDDAYGPKSRQYVDGVPGVMGNLRTALIAQAVTDDRVKAASVVFIPDATAPDEATFDVSLVLIGGHKPEPISVSYAT